MTGTGGPKTCLGGPNGFFCTRTRSARDGNPYLRMPLGFAGGLHDWDTGLVRFGWRDDDPDTGRFTAQDPIGAAGGDTNIRYWTGTVTAWMIRSMRWTGRGSSKCSDTRRSNTNITVFLQKKRAGNLMCSHQVPGADKGL
ncbi:MAG: RHS repeat-associated core domain-containing protein [Desulfovibrionaceae bacterium]